MLQSVKLLMHISYNEITAVLCCIYINSNYPRHAWAATGIVVCLLTRGAWAATGYNSRLVCLFVSSGSAHLAATALHLQHG